MADERYVGETVGMPTSCKTKQKVLFCRPFLDFAQMAAIQFPMHQCRKRNFDEMSPIKD